VIARRVLLALSLALVSVPSRAQGGPPMITDDPDTVGDKNWEINAADIAAFSRTQRLDAVPYLDINYGVGERYQVKIEGGYGLSRIYGGSTFTGMGPLLAGVRWRFLDQEKDGLLSISMFPQFGFHPAGGSTDADIDPPGNAWLLPFEFSKRWGPFALNPDVGYQYRTQGGDSWFGGFLAAYEPRPELEFMAELHYDVLVSDGRTDLLYNIGARVPMGWRTWLLASAGHTLWTLPGVDPSWITYLGLQFRL
jgi:hypothetical protein